MFEKVFILCGMVLNSEISPIWKIYKSFIFHEIFTYLFLWFDCVETLQYLIDIFYLSLTVSEMNWGQLPKFQQFLMHLFIFIFFCKMFISMDENRKWNIYSSQMSIFFQLDHWMDKLHSIRWCSICTKLTETVKVHEKPCGSTLAHITLIRRWFNG